MEIKITGTQKEVTEFIMAVTKSAEQNNNTDTITHTEYNFMNGTKSTVDLPLTRSDIETVEQLTKNIHEYARDLPKYEAERSQK